MMMLLLITLFVVVFGVGGRLVTARLILLSIWVLILHRESHAHLCVERVLSIQFIPPYVQSLAH
jgi:hypothetical protein